MIIVTLDLYPRDLGYRIGTSIPSREIGDEAMTTLFQQKWINRHCMDMLLTTARHCFQNSMCEVVRFHTFPRLGLTVQWVVPFPTQVCVEHQTPNILMNAVMEARLDTKMSPNQTYGAHSGSCYLRNKTCQQNIHKYFKWQEQCIYCYPEVTMTESI